MLNYCIMCFWIACLCNNMQNIVQIVTVELYLFSFW